MNKNCKLWLNELESGSWVQLKNELHPWGKFTSDYTAGHCCLGVAEVLMPPDKRGNVDDETLYPNIEEWLGISVAQGSTLVQANDNLGLDFKQIAKLVRSKKFQDLK